MMFANLSAVIGQVRAGTLRALAVASPKRSPTAPDIPTLAEQGLTGCEVETWFGVVAPAGTPPEIIKRLHVEIAKAVRLPSMQRFTSESGARLVGNSPDEFAKLIVDERKKWGEIVKAANISAE
jgi:tripartite-type tricarboxylate transporter receptor subunit TctC